MTTKTETQEYKEFTRTTAIYPTQFPYNLFYLTLGLTSEAGEVAGKLKKFMRDDAAGAKVTEEQKDKLLSELSDVVWYTVRLLDELGLDIEDAMEYNTQKLASRKERGVLGGSGDNR